MERRLGIFWLVRDKLVIESAPLSQAEPYGDHQTFPEGHIEFWKQLQSQGRAPIESEYEEFPRGRVMYHSASGEFTILADRCILRRKDVVAQIQKALNLPSKVNLDRDAHYRCFVCLYGETDDED